MLTQKKYRLAAGGVVLLALFLVPAPLLPPHQLAKTVASALGIGWKPAYLFTVLALQAGFYCALGVVAALSLERASSPKVRLGQFIILPITLTLAIVVIRSLKLGFLPLLENALVPLAGCALGVALGFGVLYRRAFLVLFSSIAVICATLWGMLGGVSGELSSATELCLKRLVAAASTRADSPGFGQLVMTAFESVSSAAPKQSRAVEQNRAAILALGIALGDERIARFVGLKRDRELTSAVSALRSGMTLAGREDWARHYTLSAALVVLDGSLASDASGLLKEQLDALTGGTGFSFGDLAADMAGARFASVATSSEGAAMAIQAKVRAGFDEREFFPSIADLPENLTTEQFRDAYGGVGTQAYRKQLKEIEERLEKCAALSPKIIGGSGTGSTAVPP